MTANPPLVHAPRRRLEADPGPVEAAPDAAAASVSDRLVKGAYLAVRPEGRLLEVHLPGMPPPLAATRGACDGFSDDSRRRLMDKLHSIRRDAPLPLLLTLTFPAEVAVTPGEAKACLRAFSKRCSRDSDEYAAIWRLEAHPELSTRLGRVHPHFHLLTWGIWFDLGWLNETWSEVVWSVLDLDPWLWDESGQVVRDKHRKAGTSVERIRKWAGVSYCAKQYIAKEEGYALGHAGRVWGWHAEDNLPLADEELIPLTVGQCARVRAGIIAWMWERGIQSDYLMGHFYVESPMELVAKWIGGGGG